MTSIEWQKLLQEQRDRHGKTVFTVTELANVSSMEPQSLKAALARLVERGVVERYTKGRYGLPRAVSIEDLVSSLDLAAYVTGMYALHRHGLITQSPTEITCFTNHRHNRSRVRLTPLGRIVFVSITNSVYAYPQERVVAAPEQALCDFVYLCRKRGIVPSDIVTFRNLARLNRRPLRRHLKRYPGTVVLETEPLLESLGSD